MPANEIHPSLSAFANGFKPGKHLGIKSSDDKDGLFDLFDEFGDSHSVYLKEPTELFPNLVELIEKDIDLRSIFLLMVTFNQGPLAKDFLKCLEDNNIFFPIDKPYYSYISCPHFFAEVAALGEADVTKSLFQYGINGFKHKLKNDLSEKEKQEKIHEFAEELLAVIPSAGKMSTLEYVISAVSPVVLMNEGFGNDDVDEKFIFGEFAYSETYYSKTEELETTYQLPWKTIKVLTELGHKYKIDLAASESRHISSGDKIFDIISKADNKEVMLNLVKGFVYPYSKDRNQDIELTAFGANLENYYFCVDIDGMHYNDNPSNVLINMSPQQMKARCEAILTGTPKITQDVAEILERQDERLRTHSFRLRSHSGDIKDHGVTLEKHEHAIEELQKEGKRFRETIEKLDESLIFKQFDGNKSLERIYEDLRDTILKELAAASKGDHDVLMDLMLKNGSIVAGTLDFLAGAAGAPGVIAASFGAITYACKYFQKLHDEQVSEDMKKMLLGPLNLPELIARGVAGALTLNAKENIKIHHIKLDKEDVRIILKEAENTISRQLSGRHLDELMKLELNPELDPNRKEKDIFEDIREKLMDSVINCRPVTSDLLAVLAEKNEGVNNNSFPKKRSFLPGFLKSRKESINHHPHTNREKVKELFQRPINPALIHNGQDSLKMARAGSDHSHGSSGSSSIENSPKYKS